MKYICNDIAILFGIHKVNILSLLKGQSEVLYQVGKYQPKKPYNILNTQYSTKIFCKQLQTIKSNL